MAEQKWSYKTQVHINKPVLMMGFTSLQAFAVIGILALNVVIGVSFLGIDMGIIMINEVIIFAGIFMISAKFKKEQKKGNFDYIGSKITFLNTPKKIVDDDHLFNFLIKEDE